MRVNLPESLFGGSNLSSKYLLTEPHYSYLLARSAAMSHQMSFARTRN